MILAANTRHLAQHTRVSFTQECLLHKSVFYNVHFAWAFELFRRAFGGSATMNQHFKFAESTDTKGRNRNIFNKDYPHKITLTTRLQKVVLTTLLLNLKTAILII